MSTTTVVCEIRPKLPWGSHPWNITLPNKAEDFMYALQEIDSPPAGKSAKTQKPLFYQKNKTGFI